MDFKQDITINDANYTVFINLENDPIANTENTNDTKFKITVVGNNFEFVNIFEDIDNSLELLKNSLRLKYGLTCNAKIDNTNLILTPSHPMIKIKNEYMLKKCNPEFNTSILIENRLQQLEKDQTTTYQITEDMLGPCIDNTFRKTMSIENVTNAINKALEVQNSPNVANNWAYVYTIDGLCHDIRDFYDITHIYQEERPVITANQIIFNRIIKLLDSSVVTHNYPMNVWKLNNGYTIFTRKYNTNIIGFIEKTSDELIIELGHLTMINYVKSCPNIKTKTVNNQQISYISKNDYFKYCYLLKLPFKIADQILLLGGTDNMKSYKYILVKDQCVYLNVENLNDDIFEYTSAIVFSSALVCEM
jgi:hypothetical protein